MTLSLYVCIVLCFWFLGNEIMYKQEPRMIYEIQKLNPKAKLQNSKEIFPFGISIENDNGVRYPIDLTIFDIKFFQYNYTKLPSGNWSDPI